jgi:hypothetical protein
MAKERVHRLQSHKLTRRKSIILVIKKTGFGVRTPPTTHDSFFAANPRDAVHSPPQFRGRVRTLISTYEMVRMRRRLSLPSRLNERMP